MNHNYHNSHQTGESCSLAHNSEQEKIVKEIAQIKEFPAMEAILEVTYKYKNIKTSGGQDGFFNVFFTDLTGFSYEKILEENIPAHEIISLSEAKIDEYIAKMDEIDKKIDASYCSKTEKILLKKIVESSKNKLNITRLGLPFELEKSGILTDISSEEKTERIEKMNEIQNKEFGKNISENPAEISQTLFWIRKNFHKNAKFLSENEKNILKNSYNRLSDFAKNNFPDLEIPDLEDFETKTMRNDLKNFENIQISREDYVKIFELVIEVMGLHQKVEISDEYSSVFDGEKILGIPAKNDYANLPLSRVIELLSHEILVHYVNQRNSDTFLCGIRGAGNIEKEEGLAMLMEGIIAGKTPREVLSDKRGLSDARMFAAEVFEGNELVEILNIFSAISTGKKPDLNNKSLLLRVSRNFPFGEGFQKKDRGYGEWLANVVEFLEKWGDIKALFSGKFSIGDISSGLADFSSRPEMLYPFFVADMIIFYLENRKNEKMNHENFMNFLREKYSHILKENDFETIYRLSFSVQRKILQILKVIEKSR